MVAQIERREAQVDRDSALFLGRQSIGVDAGQGADQGGLAVVDGPAVPSTRSRAPSFMGPYRKSRFGLFLTHAGRPG